MFTILTWCQTSNASKDLTPFLINLGILIGVLVVAGIILVWLRKRMFSTGLESPVAGTIFEDLRRLRDSGEMSELEYDYLRKCIAAKAAGREAPPIPEGLNLGDQELRARPGFDLTGEPIPPEVLEAERRQKKSGR